MGFVTSKGLGEGRAQAILWEMAVMRCWVWQSVSQPVWPPSVTGLELALAPNIQSEFVG